MTSATDWRLAVDIGGTFTDFVLLDAATGTVAVDKVLTTPSNPLDGVRQGVTQLLAATGVRPADITAPIVHATTLITNALIEGKAGRAALVTTAGFGDTLLIRDEHRYDMYDLQIEFPAPPIPRDADVRDRRAHRCRRSRCSTRSDRRRPRRADRGDRGRRCRGGRRLPAQLLRQRRQRAARRRAPACRAGGAGVHLVGGVAADPRVPAHGHDRLQRGDDAGDRSVPRRAAEVAVVRRLRRLGADDAVERRRGVGRRRRPHADPPRRVGPGRRRARRQLVRQAPRRGPAAVLRHGRHDGQGLPRRARRAGAHEHVRGRPRVPVQEGLRASRCRCRRSTWSRSAPAAARSRATDQFGLLKVGPESAGAEPGPASYGRGGTEPAVTDADVVLGLLDPAGVPRRRHAARRGRRRGGRRPRRRRARPRRDRRPRPASTRSSTRTWPRPPACTPSSTASTCAASRCSRSAAPARSTPAASPSCSTRPRDLPGQRQRAVGVRHAGVAGAHRPRPLDAAPARRGRPGRARRAARRAPRRGPARARGRRRVGRRRPVPLRARRPLHRAGQRGHGVGRRGRRVARRRRRGASPRSRTSTAGSSG